MEENEKSNRGPASMTPEQENVLLKRQLTTAITALERIQTHTGCPDPGEGGCIPRYSCPYELSRDALADIARINKEKNAAPDWGVKFIAIGENGWRANFYVEQQSFILFEDQGEDEGNGEPKGDILDHARWFRDMLFHALAKLGINTTTAKERVEQG